MCALKILLVDDEPGVLDVTRRLIGDAYEVRTATSGLLALEMLAREPEIAIVVSDMRMPQMDGRAFLARARAAAPNAVRLLLTGECDMADAIGAINEGAIFRFLQKPCPQPLLRSMLADAAEQHRLIHAERELLEQTLRGAVKALCDTFALVNPSVFGIAMRIKRLASDIASRVGGTELWQIEIAAMLCQLGAMTLPPDIYERRARGEHLSRAESEMLERVPQITDQLLAPIPRLEPVREIVLHTRSDRRMVGAIPRGAHVLRVALDFDELETAGLTSKEAIARMRSSVGLYEPAVLEALADLYLTGKTTTVELLVAQLLEGMVLATDVLTNDGKLLISRGQEVTPGMIRRLDNFDTSIRQRKVAVVADPDCTPIRRYAA
jgi:response regulator RpfG family c-di-GMP phosphodiesterase